ncbi:MAG: hypothetical protein R3C68_04620 [Myxococcota bacterium]
MFDVPDNRSQTIHWIRTHYSQMLGEHCELLDEPGGLEKLIEMVRSGEIRSRRTT